MKRILSMIMVLALCAGFMVFDVSAATGTAYISGPDEVHAGETITIVVGVNGGDIFGIEGQFSYDSSLVTLVSVSKKISSGAWAAEEGSDNSFAAWDDTLENPANGKTGIVTAKFKVNAAATPGTAFVITLQNIVLMQGIDSVEPANQSYTGVILPPLSGNNDLASLTVGNAELDKAFSAGTTKYSASVPFTTEELEVSAEAADSKASVKISGTKLTAGQANKVTIKVTAENGQSKTYTITVTRGADPSTDTPQPTQPEESEPTEPEDTQPPMTQPPVTQPQTPPAEDEGGSDNCVCSWLWIVTAVLTVALVVMTILYIDLKKRTAK